MLVMVCQGLIKVIYTISSHITSCKIAMIPVKPIYTWSFVSVVGMKELLPSAVGPPHFVFLRCWVYTCKTLFGSDCETFERKKLIIEFNKVTVISFLCFSWLPYACQGC